MLTKLFMLSAPALLLVLAIAGFISIFGALFDSIETSSKRPVIVANHSGFYR